MRTIARRLRRRVRRHARRALGDRARRRAPAAAGAAPRHGASTDAQIAALQAARAPRARRDPDGYTLLAARFLQKVRETGDPGFYARADRALRARWRSTPRNAGRADRARRAAPRPPRLRRRAARRPARAPPRARRGPPLRRARRRQRRARPPARGGAHAAADDRPQARPRGATRACPTCASCAATCAARARRSSSPSRRAAATPENAAYVNTLLGDLELGRGRRAARAGAPTPRRCAQFPGYVRAQAGVGARRRRPRRPAARRSGRCARSSTRLPLPEYSSRSARPSSPRAGARRRGATSRSCARSSGCCAAPASTPDVELALFEADHGDAGAGGRAGARGVAGGAELALGRRARLGADAGRPARRPGSRGRGARWRPGSARPEAPLPRRDERPRRRPAGAGAGAAAPRAGAQPALLAAARAAGAAGAGGVVMRARLVAVAAPCCSGCCARRRVAQAHPLGNFSVNHLTFVRISHDRVDVRYVLDQAEIPTFQERGRPAAAILAAKRAEVRRGLALRVDGRPVALAFAGPGAIAFPRGQGGLRTTRVELRLRAAVRGGRARGPDRRPHVRGPGRLEGRRRAGRAAAPPCARACRRATRRASCARIRSRCSRGRPTAARRRSRCARAAARVVAPRRDGSGLTATDRSPATASPALFEDAAAGHGVLAPAAAGGVRLGRAARALAGARQGDGRGLPRRHPRHRARRASRSARP